MPAKSGVIQATSGPDSGCGRPHFGPDEGQKAPYSGGGHPPEAQTKSGNKIK